MISPLIIFVLIPTFFVGTVSMFVDGDIYYTRTRGVTVTYPYVEGLALGTSNAGNMDVIVAGLDDRTVGRLVFERPETRAAALDETGRLGSVLINRTAADGLRVRGGDTVTVTVADGDVTPMGVMPRTKRYRVAAVVTYDVYSSSTPAVFIDTEEARTLLGIRREEQEAIPWMR